MIGSGAQILWLDTVSLIFAPLVSEADGMLPLSLGNTPPTSPRAFQGLLLDPGGAIFATVSNPIDHYNVGLPFDVDGRLCVSEAAPDRFDQSVPFTASDRVAFTGGSPAVLHTNQGVNYAANSTLATK